MSKKGISRRQFIQGTASGALGVGLGLPSLHCAGGTAPEAAKIVQRTLGRTGLRIPLLSFGVMNAENPELVHRALDMGVTHLDTAYLYQAGKSEEMIGEVLAERGDRDKVIVATKMRLARDREKHVYTTEGNAREPGATAQNLYDQLETSLSRLRTDYVDILYLHSLYSPAMATYEPLMEAMVKVKEQGKARFIGISTHRDEPNVIRAAVDTGIYDVALTAYNYLQDHRDEVRSAIAYAAEHGVGVIAMKTQGGVRLNQEGTVEINHAASLKWVLADENVCTTIPGMTTFDQLDLDFGVMADLALTEAERRDLEITAMLPGPLFCQNCRNCVATCPSRVEVPNLMRAYMYAEGYGNVQESRATVAMLPTERGLAVCAACESCRAECPRGIPIGSRIRALSRREQTTC